MTFKMLSIAAVALSLAAGAAYAQTTTEPDQTAPSGRDEQRSIADPGVVGRMYSDEGMTKMRSKEEMKAEWDKMPDEHRAKVQTECQDPQNAKEQDFCDTIGGF